MNMEDWLDAVEGVSCTEPNMFLDFSDTEVYAQAKTAWGWINNKVENEVVLFANHPNCGKKDSRKPFKIMSVQFDDAAFKVVFHVDPFDSYNDFLSKAELTYVTAARPDDELGPSFWDPADMDVIKGDDTTFSSGPAPARKRSARDVDGIGVQRRQQAQADISINRNFNNITIFSLGVENESGGTNSEGTVDLICAKCGVRGNLQIIGKIEWDKAIGAVPVRAFVDFKATSVQALAKLELIMAGEVNSERRVFLYGAQKQFEIEHLVEGAIDAAIGAGYVLNLKAQANISFGVTGQMADGTKRICLWGCDSRNDG